MASASRSRSRRSTPAAWRSPPSASASPVDQHLEVAGELLEGDGDLKAKARSALEAGSALFSNDDDVSYAVAQQVLEGRHTWIEEGIADPAGHGPMLAERPAEVSRRC